MAKSTKKVPKKQAVGSMTKKPVDSKKVPPFLKKK